MTFRYLLERGFGLWGTFGFRHAFGRAWEYSLAQIDYYWKTRLYNRLKPDGPVERNILGNLMRLDTNDYGIHRELFVDGIREPIATAHTMRVLSAHDVVLEIGANIGYYVLLSAQRCKKVYAVEPHPENMRALKDNLALNSYNNVEVYQLGFGDIQETANMYVSRRANRHSFRRTNHITKEQIEVQMDTVDNFLKDKTPPTFVRMDVEGHEVNILRGMPRTLRTVNRLFLELHADILDLEETREVIDTLADSGLHAELVVRYDRPGLARILPLQHIDAIYRGDKAAYEMFFVRAT